MASPSTTVSVGVLGIAVGALVLAMLELRHDLHKLEKESN
jgi:hypothetical protein